MSKQGSERPRLREAGRQKSQSRRQVTPVDIHLRQEQGTPGSKHHHLEVRHPSSRETGEPEAAASRDYKLSAAWGLELHSTVTPLWCLDNCTIEMEKLCLVYMKLSLIQSFANIKMGGFTDFRLL